MSLHRHLPLGWAIALALLVSASTSHAAWPWIDRSITLPRHDWAFDFGLGVGHVSAPGSPTGVGLNLEGSVGVTQHLELGLRTGFRFGEDGRIAQADQYGRLFDRQTFGTRNGDVANPEFRIRGALVTSHTVELALEGRAIFPFERGSRFGAIFGMPVWFRIGQSVRLDTGVYVPFLFYDPITYALSVPLDVWIQATKNLWLGPMTGIRAYHQGGADRMDIALGFGLGYALARTIDLKTMMLMPGINHTEGARNFGVGVGIQVRIE